MEGRTMQDVTRERMESALFILAELDIGIETIVLREAVERLEMIIKSREELKLK
jgi:hypothetical protein